MRTITALVLAFAAGFPLAGYAAEPMNLAEEAKAQRLLLGEHPEDRLPDVVVPEVTLPKAAYEQGEAIAGSARVSNVGALPARIVLATAVVEGQGDDGEIVAFGEQTEPIELAPGEERAVPFSVDLPAGRPFSGARVEVTVRLDGSATLDWGYSPFFSVSGDGDFVYISFAAFGDGEPLLSGPFVREGESLAVDVEVTSGAAGGEVVPTVRLANRAVDSLATFTGQPIPLASGYSAGRVTVSPANLVPGVYEGELAISGRGGRAVDAPAVPLRVVVDGDSATVHAVHSSVAAVSRGDEFSVFVEGAGTPIDVRRPSSAESRAWRGTVRVSARDVGGDEIASGEWRGVIGDSFSAEVPMSASGAAPEMRGLVEVLDGSGRVVFSREYALVTAAGAPAAVPSAGADGGDWRLSALGLLGAIILSGVLVALRRRREAVASAVVAGLVVFAALSAGPRGASADVLPAACDSDPGCFLGANEWAEVVSRKAAGNAWQAIYDRMQLSCEVCDTPLAANTDLISDVGTVPSEANATSININLFRPNGAKINLPSQRPYCGETLRVEAKATFLACENTGIVGRMSSQLFYLPNGPSGAEEALSPVETKKINKGSFGGGHTFYPFTYTVNYTSDRITKDGWYRVYVRAGSSDGVSSVTSGRIDYVDFYVGDCDRCANIAGAQNVVPAGMVRTTGGNCECPSGSTYDAADGRCEDDRGTCTTCCPAGQKYCDGACVDAAAACGTVTVNSCPIAPSENQHCVQMFDADGNQTLPGYTTQDLEKIFGFGLRDARFGQTDAAAAGQARFPIFGVIGRTVSGNGESAGCAGIACSYGVAGCLTLTDAETNAAIADCTPVNDLPGAAGQSPTAKLAVEPSVVGQGGRCEVFWSSHEMRACQVSGQGVSATTLAGSAMTAPLSQTAAYTITCTGIDGQTYADSDTCAVDPEVAEF